jgi:hypothetical protein
MITAQSADKAVQQSLELITLFSRIKDDKQRQAIIEIVRAAAHCWPPSGNLSEIDRVRMDALTKLFGRFPT